MLIGGSQIDKFYNFERERRARQAGRAATRICIMDPAAVEARYAERTARMRGACTYCPLCSLIKVKLLLATGKNAMETLTGVVREAVFGRMTVPAFLEIMSRVIAAVRLVALTLATQ